MLRAACVRVRVRISDFGASGLREECRARASVRRVAPSRRANSDELAMQQYSAESRANRYETVACGVFVARGSVIRPPATRDAPCRAVRIRTRPGEQTRRAKVRPARRAAATCYGLGSGCSTHRRGLLIRILRGASGTDSGARPVGTVLSVSLGGRE